MGHRGRPRGGVASQSKQDWEGQRRAWQSQLRQWGGVGVCSGRTGDHWGHLLARLRDWKLPKAVGFPTLILASVSPLENLGSEYPSLDVLILGRCMPGN